MIYYDYMNITQKQDPEVYTAEDTAVYTVDGKHFELVGDDWRDELDKLAEEGHEVIVNFYSRGKYILTQINHNGEWKDLKRVR